MLSLFDISFILLCPIVQGHLQQRQTANIPGFVKEFAPLVYLDQNDLYLPSDIGAQVTNTIPTLNYTALSNSTITIPSPLSLENLSELNSLGGCTAFGTCSLYLTSKEDIAANPPWLYGVLPDPVTLETVGAKSCAIIVNDHGEGTVDAFYMYFYAFNLGEDIFGQVLGDHVGDWEHSMVRFVDEKPVAVWLSQHDYGQAFTYESLSKNGSRPIIYSAIGSHANFAVPGVHTRDISVLKLNDTTSPGPLWDPTLSAYYYTYSPTSSINGTFTPKDSSTPVSWLYYLGRWGDEQYPDSDPRQVNFGNLNISWKYETGPTGPLNKDLNRTDTCPEKKGTGCTTLSILPATSGTSVPVTVTRNTSSSVTGTATTTTLSSGGPPTTLAPTTTGQNGSGRTRIAFGAVMVAIFGTLLT